MVSPSSVDSFFCGCLVFRVRKHGTHGGPYVKHGTDGPLVLRSDLKTSAIRLPCKVKPMSKRTWKQRGRRLLFIFLIPYLLVAVLVSLFESRLVYPNRGAGGFELTSNISGLSLVSFKTTDGLVLRGMFYNPENSEGVVLFCHGNGEWIGRHEQWVPSRDIHILQYFHAVTISQYS